MTDLEIQEQLEKSWEKINFELPNGVNPTAYMYGFKDCAKWMQEQDKWIEIKSKDDLPKIRCYCRFFDKPSQKIICGQFLNNGKDEINFILANASHYMIINEPSPPKTKYNV